MIRFKSGRTSAVIIILFAAFVFAFVHYALRYFLITKPAMEHLGERGEVSFLVVNYPQESQYGFLVPVKAFGINIALYTTSMPDVRPGDTVTAYVVLGSSNNKDYTLKASQAKNLAISHADSVPLTLLPAKLRHELIARIYTLFDENAAPFAAALITGNRSGFSTAFTSALSVTGLSHTVAISGLHISYIIGIFIWIFGGTRRAAPFAIPIIILFTAVIGFPPSAVRACVMNILVLVALMIKRDYDSRVALALAFAIIVVINPETVRDIGFQLSFLSTFGIITFANKWSIAGIATLPHKLKFLSGAVKSLATTAAALVFTVPLVAFVFGVFSLIAPITNLLVLPLISVMFIGTILAVVLSFIFMPFAKIVALCFGWLFKFLNCLVTTTATFPLAAIYVSNVLTIVLLIFQYALLFLFYLAWQRGFKSFMPVCAMVCAYCFVILGTSIYYDRFDSMRVTAVDVGQGQGLILASKGRSVIIDCGGSYADYVMPAAVLSQGASTVDALVLSHLHADHTNGVATLLERIKVNMLIFFDDGGEDTAEIRAALEVTAARVDTEVFLILDDASIQMADCRLDLLVPRDGEEVNERCLSVLADYNGFTMLTTGDLDGAGERKLLRFAEIPTLDVLVVGHHGSKYSTSETLLQYTRPKTAIISVGANNYGHPADETLERLENAGVSIYSTNDHGSITFTVGGKNGRT